ncbi:MAG: sigma 54-interacting transcriptional regulator [Polyangiaceae bacterium]
MSDATETRHDTISEAVATPRPGVLILFTEDRPIVAPVPISLAKPSVFGRDAKANVVLDDTQASREHTRVSPGEGGFVVEDLGSRNGTFAAGRRVSGPSHLPFGCTLRIGRTLLLAVLDVEPHRIGAVNSPLLGAGNMEALRTRIREIAGRLEPVLIEGETGVGKERVSEAIHLGSGRSGALVAVNCAALPKDLVEAELFGHAKGAFSGSERAREGLFRAATGGTLLLDEVGDLPLDAQAKLLRVLETGEVRAVGEDRQTVVDVRVIAATNVPLERHVSEGRFRADLFHRLAAWRVAVPPLREHPEDVPLLARHFEADARFSVEAMETLLAAQWPGNVRELRNAVRTAAASAISAGSAHVQSAHLPAGLVLTAERPRAANSDADDVFRARVDTALRLRTGNVAQVARDLGVGRPWLYSVLKRLGIDPSAYR